MLRHCNLPVYDRLALQNILVMPVELLRFGLDAGMQPVGLINLGVKSSFVKQSQVGLEVKVSAQAVV